MKLTSTIPLFCVALLGYLSFTLQSNATSTGKQSGCTSSGLRGWEMIESDSHSTEEVVLEYDFGERHESNDEKWIVIESQESVAGCRTKDCDNSKSNLSNPSNNYGTLLGTVKEPKNPSGDRSESKNNPKASTIPREIKRSGKSRNDLSKLPSMIKSDLDRDLLWLDLTDDFYLPYYTEVNLTTWKYSRIFLQMNDQSNLYRLTKAFSERTVTDFNFNINSNQKNLDKLFEIIKKKQFKSLLFYDCPSNNEHAKEFIEKLGNQISFWTEMESLSLWKFPKNQIIKILKNFNYVDDSITFYPFELEPLKLKRLSININSTDDEPIDNLNIPCVEELNLEFFHHEKHRQDIEGILSIFPNIKKGSIYVSGEMEYFEIEKNDKLEELKIICKKLKEEDKFVEYLKENTNLSSFSICQIKSKDINWKRELPTTE